MKMKLCSLEEKIRVSSEKIKTSHRKRPTLIKIFSLVAPNFSSEIFEAIIIINRDFQTYVFSLLLEKTRGEYTTSFKGGQVFESHFYPIKTSFCWEIWSLLEVGKMKKKPKFWKLLLIQICMIFRQQLCMIIGQLGLLRT